MLRAAVLSLATLVSGLGYPGPSSAQEKALALVGGTGTSGAGHAIPALSSVVMAAEQSAQRGGVAIEISRDVAQRRDALLDGDGCKAGLI
jgi:hypothetical protein